ncbi:GNAT family N-acetyltransferase [Paenibacillus sp. NPDC056579]|uniref:GNAT family N-acetyltransferase n=1 Tax=Paenibacillus sp. NPDC056579 TaxID=3345871 RepID=UPI0036C7D211
MIHRAKQLLSVNMLENITLLKMLETYGDRMECKFMERERDWGLLLSLPIQLSLYDRKTYPECEAIILVSGSDPNSIAPLVEALPQYRPIIFKVQNDAYRQVIATKFSLELKRAFHTYSCREPIRHMQLDDVAEEDRYQDKLAELWIRNGYEAGELQRMFDAGARSYSIYELGEPVSTCLTCCIYGMVWEIGAVFTKESYRGKGYAKKVVSAAVNRLLNEQSVPRYQVVNDNAASIQLAESLGLSREVTLQHYVYKGM